MQGKPSIAPFFCFTVTFNPHSCKERYFPKALIHVAPLQPPAYTWNTRIFATTFMPCSFKPCSRWENTYDSSTISNLKIQPRIMLGKRLAKNGNSSALLFNPRSCAGNTDERSVKWNPFLLQLPLMLGTRFNTEKKIELVASNPAHAGDI